MKDLLKDSMDLSSLRDLLREAVDGVKYSSLSVEMRQVVLFGVHRGWFKISENFIYRSKTETEEKIEEILRRNS